MLYCGTSLSTAKVVESRVFDIIHLDWKSSLPNFSFYYWPCRFFGSVMIASNFQPDFRTAVNFEKILNSVGYVIEKKREVEPGESIFLQTCEPFKLTHRGA